MEGKLDDTYKKFLKGEIRQVVASYIALLLVVAVACTAASIFIQQSALSLQVKRLLPGFLSGIGLITLCFFLWNSLKNPLADLRCGTKKIVMAQVLDQQDSTIYGWTGNVGADSSSQPKLVEFRLMVNDMQLVVGPDDFARFAVGDKVQVHLSQVTGKLLRLE